MRKSIALVSVLLAATSLLSPAVLAFSTDSGSDPALASGLPHLTDPDEQTPAAFFGLGSGGGEANGYYMPGFGGSAARFNIDGTPDDGMYHSGFSFRPEKGENTVRLIPNQ